uniref:protein acetyllysine N-acetyltransferase n=1 Tax=Candidatus Desulfatibia profunda TaxID=2841695 RepID=A0A8J6NN17_9BACT|nr:hypothetical protein [Candidatus Desulfatibia profunda]
MKNVKQAAETIKASSSVLVLTGAGVSAESGIPTYRGPDGLYTKSPDLENILTLENLKNNPIKIWEYINTLRILLVKSVPNKAHMVLAKWEKEGGFNKFLIATQNVDGLHGLAGNNLLTELHGNIWELARPKQVDYAEDEQFSEEMQAYLSGKNRDLLRRKWSRENNQVVWENREVPFQSIPPCTDDPEVRPNVLLFDEGYGNRLLWVEHFIKDGCDLLIVVGCSGGVYIVERLLNDMRYYNPTCNIININPYEDCVNTDHIYLKCTAVEAFEILNMWI